MVRLSTKYVFILLNGILMLSSQILLITGTSLKWSLRQKSSLLNRYTFTLTSLTTAFGALLFCLSSLAYPCVFCENANLLLAYSYSLLILIVVELVVGIAGFVTKFNILSHINNLLLSAEQNYTSDVLAAQTWDNLQQNLKCCGVYDHTEWHLYFGNSSLPHSCCDNFAVTCGRDGVSTGDVYLVNCAHAIETWVQKHGVLVAIFFGLLICLKVITLIVGCKYKKLLRESYAKIV